jgi:hypothetical protein
VWLLHDIWCLLQGTVVQEVVPVLIFLNLDISWRWVVSVTHQTIYRWENIPPVLTRCQTLCPQTPVGTHGEEERLWPLAVEPAAWCVYSAHRSKYTTRHIARTFEWSQRENAHIHQEFDEFCRRFHRSAQVSTALHQAELFREITVTSGFWRCSLWYTHLSHCNNNYFLSIFVFTVFIKIVCLYGIWDSHNSGYEEFHHLGYNAVWSVESQLTFRWNKSPPFSGSKFKPNEKPAWSK